MRHGSDECRYFVNIFKYFIKIFENLKLVYCYLNLINSVELY